MTNSFAFLSILSVLSHLSPSQAECTRAALQSAVDSFFSSAINNSTYIPKLAPNVKIVENNIRKKSIEETSHSAIVAFARPFKLTAIDTQQCTVASLVVVNMTQQEPAERSAKGSVPNQGDDCKGSGKPTTGLDPSRGPFAPRDGKDPWPNLISFRARVSETVGELTELEIVNVGTGTGGNAGTLLQTVFMPQDPGPIWSAPLQTAKGTAAPNRDQLVQILDSYPEGIHRHVGSGVKTAPKCERIENGRRGPSACGAGFEQFKHNVTNRDWVVDTETGISLGKFFFERETSPLWIHEYFKITDGLIQEIYAAIVPWGCSIFKDNLKSP